MYAWWSKTESGRMGSTCEACIGQDDLQIALQARDAEQAHALPCRTPATTQLPLYNSQFHIQDLAPRTQRVPAVVLWYLYGQVHVTWQAIAITVTHE